MRPFLVTRIAVFFPDVGKKLPPHLTGRKDGAAWLLRALGAETNLISIRFTRNARSIKMEKAHPSEKAVKSANLWSSTSMKASSVRETLRTEEEKVASPQEKGKKKSSSPVTAPTAGPKKVIFSYEGKEVIIVTDSTPSAGILSPVPETVVWDLGQGTDWDDGQLLQQLLLLGSNIVFIGTMARIEGATKLVDSIVKRHPKSIQYPHVDTLSYFSNKENAVRLMFHIISRFPLPNFKHPYFADYTPGPNMRPSIVHYLLTQLPIVTSTNQAMGGSSASSSSSSAVSYLHTCLIIAAPARKPEHLIDLITCIGYHTPGWQVSLLAKCGRNTKLDKNGLLQHTAAVADYHIGYESSLWHAGEKVTGLNLRRKATAEEKKAERKTKKALQRGESLSQSTPSKSQSTQNPASTQASPSQSASTPDSSMTQAKLAEEQGRQRAQKRGNIAAGDKQGGEATSKKRKLSIDASQISRALDDEEDEGVHDAGAHDDDKDDGGGKDDAVSVDDDDPDAGSCLLGVPVLPAPIPLSLPNQTPPVPTLGSQFSSGAAIPSQESAESTTAATSGTDDD